MARCTVCRTPASLLAGALGLGLFAKATDAGPGGIHVTKSLEINAARDQVFDFFSQPHNYLRISDIVTKVEVFGDGRFAKQIAIAGAPVYFEERFLCCEPHLVETRSEPASAFQFTKQLKLDDVGDGCTRLHLYFNYHPPGGAIGHAIASALGIDAKSLLTDLLMRAKFFLETGREPHDATGVRRERMKEREHAGNGQGEQHPRYSMSSPQGPAAPANDVHRPGMHGLRVDSPWPPSSEGRPDSAGSPGHFPPIVD